MIYIQQGLRGGHMTPTDHNLEQFLESYSIPSLQITVDNKDQLKASAPYGFGGQLGGDNRRVKASVQYRDLIALDLDHLDHDNLHDNQDALFNALRGALGCRFWLYPSITNGLLLPNEEQPRFRYRVVIPTPPLKPTTYSKLVEGLSNWLVKNRILTAVDESNFKVAQIFGLPVATQYSTPPLISENQMDQLTEEQVKRLLSKFASSKSTNDGALLTVDYHKIPHYSKGGSPKWAGELLNQIWIGTNEGSRNQELTQLIGKMLWAGVTPEITYRYAMLYNSHSTPPLTDGEVNKTFLSILRREEKKNDKITNQ